MLEQRQNFAKSIVEKKFLQKDVVDFNNNLSYFKKYYLIQKAFSIWNVFMKLFCNLDYKKLRSTVDAA